ncbi:Hypothetical protein, putative [Bodo saltans]|uniref:EF-hand domain-containing protein n=1 Tax=Bodo saltans TaxID=75058 RepID=A0A0S4JT13_BODSA|nr:Hypothetical protein, putative [Bodo saltans]|eukprot:CUG93379.1 Hypothetical protein, putative [Bodo saltans]
MHRRLAAVAKWMDHVNARSHCVDVFDRLASLLVQATLFVEDAPVRGNLQILSTHILIVDDGNNIVQSIELDHIHSIKRYQEVLFPNRTFAELPRFRSTLELYITNAAVHKLVLDGDHAVRISQFIELLWKFHFGKMATRQELTCRGFHLGDALYALSLLPLDLDCTLSQQIQGSAVVNVEKSIVLRIDEGFQLAMIFRPETLADTAHARAIELNLDQIHLISTREDEVRIVCEDGRAFLLHSVADHSKMLDHFMCVYLLNAANAATMVYRRLHFNYPFFTFRHSEVMKLYDHYLHIDSNGDGHISQEEFNATLGPILVQVRSVPKALYALCDCLALSKVRLFEYLHGFRVLLKGNYQDRVRYQKNFLLAVS